MTTVRQFKRVQTDFARNCETGHWRELNEKTKEELARLFNQFACEFKEQFGIDVHRARQVSPDMWFTEKALAKLKAWVMYLNRHAATPYSEWLGLDA